SSFLRVAAAALAAGVTLGAPDVAIAQVGGFEHLNKEEWSLIGLTPEIAASANNGKGSIVAVLDGLAACRHFDLGGRCQDVVFSGGQYRNDDAHGTHVAGIIAGSRSGVAPAANVINYALFDDRGYIASGNRLIAAWYHAGTRGASIASMSFGCEKTALCFSSDELAAMANGKLKMLFVKAAGNDGADLLSEASGVTSAVASAALARTIVVGSIDLNGTLSSFSNRPGEGCLVPSGATSCAPDLQWKNHFILAPGREIHAPLPGNVYGFKSGTSMATPVVAGAAALLQARWPALKSTPETVANILLKSAKDLGQPGVDPVYGWGLLDVGQAFKAAGTVTLAGTSGTSTPLTGATMTVTPTTKGLAEALGSVTVYDVYGRDYALAETGALQVRSDFFALRQMLGRRLLGQGGLSDWAAPLFARQYALRSFAMFHSPAELAGGFGPDRSIRLGVDVPFTGGLAQLRMTGASGSRLDFAYDPTLRPLSFFASSGLMKSSLVAHALVNLSDDRRLSVYGSSTARSVSVADPDDPLRLRQPEPGSTTRLALTGSPVEQRQRSIGIGYWTRPDARTVIGINASVVEQKGAYYDLTSSLDAFQNPTRMVNAGLFATRAIGGWEASAAGELTHLRMSGGAGDIGVTPANLISGELALRRRGVAFSRGPVTDSLGVALVVPPRAVSGTLRVDHMTRTPDGLGRQPISYKYPLARIGADAPKLEAAYRLGLGAEWSVELGGGVNLKREEFSGTGEVFARFRTGL
ncbi:MAG: S8 family peptidase, partial [Pseudomonadota bacterium]|nr:S8 family peptidase [Pseudomonadota bacterium]